MNVTSLQNRNKLLRLQRLQEELKAAKLDACLIQHPIDLFYLTGLNLSIGKLIISANDCLLLVDGRYLQAAQENAVCPCALDSTDTWLEFCKRYQVRKLGFDSRHVSYDDYLRLERACNKSFELVPAGAQLRNIRALKDQEEIAQMKKSAQLLWDGFEFLRSALRSGVTEKELARRFEIFCLEKGADELSFEPIIAFGPNSAMPHYRAGQTSLREGDVVLIDIGIALDGYHSDMTRVLFFHNTDPYLNKLYAIVKRAQQNALKLCRPGAKLGQLDEAARQVFKEEGVEELFVHSLGHGIGLEVHEFPRIKKDGEDKDLILEQGMVFTIEPGLYLPGTGGVRYEDTIAITADGYENFYPQD